MNRLEMQGLSSSCLPTSGISFSLVSTYFEHRQIHMVEPFKIDEAAILAKVLDDTTISDLVFA